VSGLHTQDGSSDWNGSSERWKMRTCRYFLSNWLRLKLALGRKKDDDEFVRRESQSLAGAAEGRVPQGPRCRSSSCATLKNHSLHPSSDLYLVQFYMHERGFMYSARVMPLYMPWHLLTGP
jgi:hypothetical protein